MAHLPPVGWADVATKHDLAQLESSLENRLLAAMRQELLKQTRTMIAFMTTLFVTVAGLAFAAARLT